MQKYKKWKQVLSVSTAVSLCIAGAGSLMGCGSTDRGKDKADSVESKAMGRYLENELSVRKDVWRLWICRLWKRKA